MEISKIRYLTGAYRLFPDKRSQILREIYMSDGKAGIQAFVRILGSRSVKPFINWVEKDLKNKKRFRRGQKIIKINTPPEPPGSNDFDFWLLFEDMSMLMGGCKLGKQGGKRNIFSAQAWDAIQGGGK